MVSLRLRLTVATGFAALLAGCGHSVGPQAGQQPTPTPTAASPQASSPRLPAATTLGPDGVRARWVIAENQRPGSTAWHITRAQSAHGINGYANLVQAQPGQRLTLYVSTIDTSFRVEAFRMGWYHGAGARLVWQSAAVRGGPQPACPVLAGINMVECHWHPSLRVLIDAAFVPGAYLFKLVGGPTGAQQSYVPLTVWEPASRATYVIMADVLTWQVFNDYGGYDLYTGRPLGLSGYPYPTRSRVVSFDRPYATDSGYGSGSFLSTDYPLIRFAEQHGLDVTYWTDITLDEHPALLLRHRALLSLGHDEEWSRSMRDGALAARAAGVNLAYFGASPVLRKVRLQASPLGPDREVVNYRDPSADPLYGKDNAAVSQNNWSQYPADQPDATLVGATYIGFDNSTSFPLVVRRPGSWLFHGTGLRAGSQVPGVFATDFQAVLPGDGAPPGVQVLATARVVITSSATRATADTTVYTWAPSGAEVFSSGTNNWIPALAPCPARTVGCPAGVLAELTGNLLARFGTHPLRPGPGVG